MIQSSHPWVHAGVMLCLALLLLACAAPPADNEATQQPADSTGAKETPTDPITPTRERATAQPTATRATVPKLVTVLPAEAEPTPEPTPRCMGTPAVKALPTTSTIIQKDAEMMPTASVSPGLQNLVDGAIADLAGRLAIDGDQIEVVEAKAVVWPDGGLGCPEPGVVYTQVQREGLLIQLRVGKRLYNYHGGGGRAPFLCENPKQGDPVP